MKGQNKMGFSLSNITKPFKKAASKVGGLVDKVDPTGITGTLLTGGLHSGGAVGGLISAGLGKSGGGSSGSAAPTRKRYQRRTRNRWKSKREKAFEAKNRRKELDKTKASGKQKSKMMTAGLGISNALKRIKR